MDLQNSRGLTKNKRRVGCNREPSSPYAGFRVLAGGGGREARRGYGQIETRNSVFYSDRCEDWWGIQP